MTSTLGTDGYRVFIGGYTAEMKGAAPGISVFTATAADADEVEFTAGTPVELVSPSFLIKHPLQPWVFAVSEAEPGQVHALRVTESGLELVNTVPSGGDGGCHLCFDQDRSHLLVAHYSSGSVASFAIGADGALSERTGLLQFTGSGPDPDRQEGPHAHQVVSVGAVILVPDLGTDQVHIVRVEADGSLAEAGNAIALPAGSGPRHVVLAANHLVVTCELSAELWVSPLDAALGSAGSTVPVSTRDTTERIYPSAVQVFRDQIIVANRGPDTLAFFRLADGTLEQTAEIDCGGSWPRDLAIDGDRLWVANQSVDRSGGNVSVFVREAELSEDGQPVWTVDFQIPTEDPACAVVVR